MDIQTVLAQYTQEQRIAITFPGMRRDVTDSIIRHVRPAPGMSTIIFSDLDSTTADAVIREQIAYFRSINQSFAWKVCSGDQPSDLIERLRAHGCVIDEVEAVMVLDLAETPTALQAPISADVRAITKRTDLRDVIAVEHTVWNQNCDWITERLGDHLDIPGYLNVYVAYIDERPASAGWIYFSEQSQFASLWGGSTIAEYRGRGLYTALLAARIQAAIRRGYRYVTIDAGPMSRPIVARHGFHVIAHACDCTWEPPTTDEPTRIGQALG